LRRTTSRSESRMDFSCWAVRSCHPAKPVRGKKK
jgi:hypothetical protein